jgi:hypothetical protein
MIKYVYICDQCKVEADGYGPGKNYNPEGWVTMNATYQHYKYGQNFQNISQYANKHKNGLFCPKCSEKHFELAVG